MEPLFTAHNVYFGAVGTTVDCFCVHMNSRWLRRIYFIVDYYSSFLLSLSTLSNKLC